MQSDDPKQGGKEILPPTHEERKGFIHLLVTIIKALVEKIRVSVTLYSVNPEF